nr:MAG TPA: hypothetical protein [Bacteriophage sp.]
MVGVTGFEPFVFLYFTGVLKLLTNFMTDLGISFSCVSIQY